MQVWQNTFKELRNQYLARSTQRLEHMELLLAHLAKKPAEPDLLRKLMRHYHWLAGSGGIYGFQQISKLGSTGEEICEKLLSANKAITRLDWEKCRALVEGVYMMLESDEDSQLATIGRAFPAEMERGLDAVVVESPQSDFLFLTRLLEEEGIMVRRCDSLPAAWEACSQTMPKFLIIGLAANGEAPCYDLVERIRGLDAGRDIPIFIVSNKSAFPDKVQAIHSGVDGFYEHPVDWESLIRRMKFLLERNDTASYKILSVEDDPDQAEFICAVLQSAGYQVCHTANPLEFEEKLLEFNPDLVLLDIMLPGVTGYELVRYLRQHDRWMTLPVLFLTTLNQLEAHVESARAGGDDHLIKPIAPVLLLSAISARLQRARFIKELIHRDGLTSLLTHTSFMEEAIAVVAAAKRNPERIACMILIDVDEFKAINQRYGYTTGDKVLVALAGVLKEHLRLSDKVGRFGGQELAAIVEDLEDFEAKRLIDRLLHDFSQIEHRSPAGEKFTVTFSAGLAMLDSRVMDAERWRHNAEQALNVAKTAGRNCVIRSSTGSIEAV